MLKPGDVVLYVHHTGVLVDATVREVFEDDPTLALLDVNEPELVTDEETGETVQRTFPSKARAGSLACTWRPKTDATQLI